MIDREITANHLLSALETVGIDVRELDAVPDALAMQEALRTIPVRPRSAVDRLTTELDNGEITPEQLHDRVIEAVHHTHTQWDHNQARSAVSDRVAVRLLQAIGSNITEIHRQLSAQFDEAASRLSTAVEQLGEVNDAGEALNQGREQSWRAVQSASGQLDTILSTVARLSDIGHGTKGSLHLWGLDVEGIELGDVAALPKEHPRDPLGQWVAWARQGQTFALADGATKQRRDSHVLAVKQAAHNPFPKATPAARASSWGEVTSRM